MLLHASARAVSRRSQHARRRRRSAARRRLERLGFEWLEDRRLLAVTANLVGTTLQVQGDALANTITVRYVPGDDSLIEVLDAAVQVGSFASVDVETIDIDAQADDDTVTVSNNVNLHRPTTIAGGTGDDDL